MVLTATKLACSLLISFALREYLVGTSMTPQTFATRFFGFRGRREVRPEEEHVFFLFYSNRITSTSGHAQCAWVAGFCLKIRMLATMNASSAAEAI